MNQYRLSIVRIILVMVLMMECIRFFSFCGAHPGNTSEKIGEDVAHVDPKGNKTPHRPTHDTETKESGSVTSQMTRPLSSTPRTTMMADDKSLETTTSGGHATKDIELQPESGSTRWLVSVLVTSGLLFMCALLLVLIKHKRKQAPAQAVQPMENVPMVSIPSTSAAVMRSSSMGGRNDKAVKVLTAGKRGCDKMMRQDRAAGKGSESDKKKKLPVATKTLGKKSAGRATIRQSEAVPKRSRSLSGSMANQPRQLMDAAERFWPEMTQQQLKRSDSTPEMEEFKQLEGLKLRTGCELRHPGQVSGRQAPFGLEGVEKHRLLPVYLQSRKELYGSPTYQQISSASHRPKYHPGRGSDTGA